MNSSSDRNVKVFISYSHDSSKHRKRVLALSDRLRSIGTAPLLATDWHELLDADCAAKMVDRQEKMEVDSVAELVALVISAAKEQPIWI